MPNITFASKEEVPEGLRDHATEKDGKWIVGVVHESFRDNNIALKRQLEATTAAVEGYKKLGEDPSALLAELEALRDIDRQVKDGSLKGTKAIEEAVAARSKAALDAAEAKISAANKAAGEWETKAKATEDAIRALHVDNAIRAAVLNPDSGANPAAVDEILARARREGWTADQDGNAICKEKGVLAYGPDGEPLKPKDWVAKLLKDAPYFSKASSGGGANGGKGQGVKGTDIPQETWDKMSPTDRLNASRKAGVA